MSKAKSVPYGRLAAFYLFYFCALGAIVPYWGLYLERAGFSHREIGVLMAILSLTKIVSPNVWGWLADRSGNGVAVVRWVAFCTTVGFAALLWLSGFLWMAVISLTFSFFWHAILPPFEAITLEYLKGEQHRYSQVRLWGSIGFILAVFGLGEVFDQVDIGCLPAIVSALFGTVWLVSLVIPQPPRESGAVQSASSFWRALMRSEVVAFFLVCLLVQMAHSPYYAFFSIYLEDHGFDKGQTGLLWSLGVLSEIVLFLNMQPILRSCSLRTLLLMAVAGGGLRWLAIAWLVDDLACLLVAQGLHAMSFGALHVVAIQLVHRYFPGAQQNRGQSLYSSVSYGLGGVLGNLFSGEFWQSLGPQYVFSAAAGFSFMAGLVAWGWVARERSPRSPPEGRGNARRSMWGARSRRRSQLD